MVEIGVDFNPNPDRLGNFSEYQPLKSNLDKVVNTAAIDTAAMSGAIKSPPCG